MIVTRFYTGVGSRETPEEIQALMTRLGRKLAGDGWTLRSGAAEGADNAFEMGWFEWYCAQTPWPSEAQVELYIPWDNFNKHTHAGCFGGVFELGQMPEEYQKLAKQIAGITHPAWDKLKQGAKKLHTRNVFQVLGQDCQTPSKMLICYATPQGKKGEVKGGTNTAVKLALQRNIPVFNLYYEEVQEKLSKYLEAE